MCLSAAAQSHHGRHATSSWDARHGDGRSICRQRMQAANCWHRGHLLDAHAIATVVKHLQAQPAARRSSAQPQLSERGSLFLALCQQPYQPPDPNPSDPWVLDQPPAASISRHASGVHPPLSGGAPPRLRPPGDMPGGPQPPGERAWVGLPSRRPRAVAPAPWWRQWPDVMIACTSTCSACRRCAAPPRLLPSPSPRPSRPPPWPTMAPAPRRRRRQQTLPRWRRRRRHPPPLPRPPSSPAATSLS